MRRLRFKSEYPCAHENELPEKLFAATLAVPWIGAFRPRLAARRMLAAPPVWCCTSTIVAAVVIAAVWVIVSLSTDFDSLYCLTGGFFWVGADVYRTTHTIDWIRGWGSANVTGAFGWLILIRAALVWLTVVSIALLEIPAGACSRGLWASLGRAHAVAASTMVAGAAIALMIAGGMMALSWLEAHWLAQPSRGYWDTSYPFLQSLAMLTPLLSVCTWMGWMSAVFGWLANESGCAPGEPPPSNGSAPAWERRHTLRNWRQASYDLGYHPSRYYRALRNAPHTDRARRFARRQYWSLGLVAAAVPGIFSLGDSLFVLVMSLPAMILILVWVALYGWLIHRLIGATVICWWLARRALPDPHDAERIVGYESALLPGIAAANVAYMFVTAYAGSKFQMVVEYGLEGWMVLNAALLVLWLWRYRRARIAIGSGATAG